MLSLSTRFRQERDVLHNSEASALKRRLKFSLFFFCHIFPGGFAGAFCHQESQSTESAHACTKTCPGVHIYAHSDKTVGAPDGSVLKLTAAEVTHTLKGLIL